jgi:hypothetical protein
MFLAVSGEHECFLSVYTYGVEIYSFFPLTKIINGMFLKIVKDLGRKGKMPSS